MSKSRKTPKVKKSPVKEVTKLASENLTRDYDTVAVAAFFKAEERNFSAGHELEDWYGAEAELTTAKK